MQQTFFAIGHFLEWTFTFLSGMGWLPVIGITAVMTIGFLYWMGLQSKYNRKAKANSTLA
ncbi:MAG: hypothetical protein IPL52_15595 [Flavobacteriales bacterium]|nr:hypothetical protein [Flavobacteriales bacterium]